jgi:hypothetical protein
MSQDKRVLILRDSKTAITIHSDYIEIKNFINSYVVAFRHIERIYLNKAIDIDISSCYAISQKVPLFIIDEDGYILAELKRVRDEEV